MNPIHFDPIYFDMACFLLSAEVGSKEVVGYLISCGVEMHTALLVTTSAIHTLNHGHVEV